MAGARRQDDGASSGPRRGKQRHRRGVVARDLVSGGTRSPRLTLTAPSPSSTSWPSARSVSSVCGRREPTRRPAARTVRPPSTATAASRSAERNWLEREASTAISPARSASARDRSGRHPSAPRQRIRAPPRAARRGARPSAARAGAPSRREESVRRRRRRGRQEPRRGAGVSGVQDDLAAGRRAAGPRPRGRPARGANRRAHRAQAGAQRLRVVAPSGRAISTGARRERREQGAGSSRSWRRGRARRPGRRAGGRTRKSVAPRGRRERSTRRRDLHPAPLVDERRQDLDAAAVHVSVQDLWKWPSRRTSTPSRKRRCAKVRIVSTGQPRLVLEVGPVEARLDVPHEAVAPRAPARGRPRRARRGFFEREAPEAVRVVPLVQEVAVRREEAAARRPGRSPPRTTRESSARRTSRAGRSRGCPRRRSPGRRPPRAPPPCPGIARSRASRTSGAR